MHEIALDEPPEKRCGKRGDKGEVRPEKEVDICAKL